MPLDPERLTRLDGFLGSVSPAVALRLARAVETDRLRGGKLPHDDILQALRPRLREAQSRLGRVASPQRLVCSAFEDLLVDTRRRKQRGRIVRSSLSPIWTWLTTTLMPPEQLTLLDSIRDRLLNAGPEFAEAEVAAFQAAASAALLAAVPSADPADAAIIQAGRALGGVDIALDAHDMARMLEIAPIVSRLQREFPKPMHGVSENDICIIRSYWEHVGATHPDCTAYVAFMILGRLEKPWEIMRLAGAMSRKTDDIVISRTDAGFVGELLLCDLEDSVAVLKSVRSEEFDAARILREVAAFANLSTGIVREIGIKREGIWGRRLMAARGGLAAEMERLLGRARKDILATLPMSRKGGFGLKATGRAPDFSKRPDQEKLQRALAFAAVISGARPYAMAGAFAGMLAEIEEPVAEHLRHYTTEMLDELRAVPPENRQQADFYVAHAVALTRLILGAEEGDLMRRRAAAAGAGEQGAALVA